MDMSAIHRALGAIEGIAAALDIFEQKAAASAIFVYLEVIDGELNKLEDEKWRMLNGSR